VVYLFKYSFLYRLFSFAEEISATTPVVQEISAGNSLIKAILETRGLRQMYELTLKQNRKIR
jgi:hypothetical protein